MEDLYKPLLQLGAFGALVCWILWKLIPTLEAKFAALTVTIETLKDDICSGLRKMEDAMDRATATDLLRLAASPLINPEIKERVAAILEDLKTAQKARALEIEAEKDKK
jgi:hypothetical protein